jgi:hypothetical protein
VPDDFSNKYKVEVVPVLGPFKWEPEEVILRSVD